MGGLKKLKQSMKKTKTGKLRYKLRTGSGVIMKNRILVVCLLVVLSICQTMGVDFVNAESTSGISLIVDDAASDKVARTGNIFNVKVKLINNSTKTLTDVKLDIVQKENLSCLGTGWSVSASSDVAPSKDWTSSLQFVYSGSENVVTLEFVCNYKIEGQPENATTSWNVYVDTQSSGNNPPAVVDTTKYKPIINIKRDIQMPVFNAGEDAVLTFPILNTSVYEAKNISISVDTTNLGALPFTFEQMALICGIEKIPANKESAVAYNIKIKPDAKEGLYPITINYQYYNIYGDQYNNSETLYIKVLNNKTPPKIILSNIKTYSNDPTPGNIMSLTLTFENQGSSLAKDIKVKLEGLSSDGITTYGSANPKFLNQIESKKEDVVEYMLIISENFTGTNVSLSAKVEYKDELGNSYSEDYTFFVRVNQKTEQKQEDKKPYLLIKDLTFPTETIKAGEEFNIGFILENTGDDIAHNVKVSISCETGILPKSMSTIVFDSINQGQAEVLKFDLFADKKATTSNHLITISVEYEDVDSEEGGMEEEDGVNTNNNAEKLSLTRYAGVYIEEVKEEEEKETEEKTVPKIIINKYSFEPEVINAGHNFKLKMSFLNTSKILPVRNIKVTFSAEEGVFIPVNSSNTFFIENMSVQEIIEKDVELYAKSDALAKSHVLNISFEYEDEKGNQFTTSEKISIPVKQEQKLVIGQLNVPQSVMEGDSIPIFLEFYNMGKSMLYNLMVNFESEGLQAENGSYFAGNFEAGRGDYFEVMIRPVATGEVTGAIVFTYEDEAGNKNEMRQEITMNVMPMSMPQIPDETQFPEQNPGGDATSGGQKSSLFTPLNIGIACGILVVVVAIIIIVRKKKRKAAYDLDE